MTAHDGAMQLLETLHEKLIIEEIPAGRGNHVHHIEVGAEHLTIHIFYQSQILVRTIGNHPGHGLDTELGMGGVGGIDDLLNHADRHIP